MGGQSAPQAYTPANQAGADSLYTNTLNSSTANNQKTYNTAQQGYTSAYNSILNNPYTAQAQTDVNNISAGAAAQGRGVVANANTLNNYAPAIAQAGFDPLSANYNYGLAQAQDAQKVANAQAGVAGSPFGAGTVGDAGAAYTRGYNADTQNRQQQAIAALAALFGQSAQQGQQGYAQQAAAAVAPQGQFNATQNENISALDALVRGLGQANAPLAENIGQAGQYLQLGQGATSLDQNAAKINNSMPGLLGGLGDLFGLSTGGGGTLGGDILAGL